MTLSQEAQDALNEADCVKNAIQFPLRLEKGIQTEVEAVMKEQGGTFMKSINAFVFDGKDAKAVLDSVLA